MESIGQQLKGLRKTKRLTQQAAAEAIGIKRSTLSNYEIDRRQPSLSEITRIAEFYGVSLDYFGIAPTDEIFDILARARNVFENESVPEEKKDALYLELMKLYMKVKQ